VDQSAFVCASFARTLSSSCRSPAILSDLCSNSGTSSYPEQIIISDTTPEKSAPSGYGGETSNSHYAHQQAAASSAPGGPLLSKSKASEKLSGIPGGEREFSTVSSTSDSDTTVIKSKSRNSSQQSSPPAGDKSDKPASRIDGVKISTDPSISKDSIDQTSGQSGSEIEKENRLLAKSGKNDSAQPKLDQKVSKPRIQSNRPIGEDMKMKVYFFNFIYFCDNTP